MSLKHHRTRLVWGVMRSLVIAVWIVINALGLEGVTRYLIMGFAGFAGGCLIFLEWATYTLRVDRELIHMKVFFPWEYEELDE